jgi:hypothetical protein
MTDRERELLTILHIGHDTTLRGAGLSMRMALTQAKYKELRSGFGPGDLIPLLKLSPEIMEEWFSYSEDQRTSGGWYLLDSGVIGQVGSPDSRISFETLEQAVAEYVVRELDFWIEVGEKNH